MEYIEVKVSEIVWRKDLYPRFEPNPSRIQQYAEVVKLLPPIEINQRKEMIDGYHRWVAHRKKGWTQSRHLSLARKATLSLTG